MTFIALMDWNWFFSAIAQSFAAIVGLVGAFIFTRLVNAEFAFTADVQWAKRLLLDAQLIRDQAASRDFEWYNQTLLERAAKELWDLLKDEGKPKQPQDYLRGLTISPWDDTDSGLRQLTKLIENFEPPPPRQPPSPFGLELPEFHEPINFVSVAEQQEEERLKNVSNEAVASARSIRDFLSVAQVNPHHSGLIDWTLGILEVLFVVGVIYPLSFLPLPQGAHPEPSVAAFFPTLFSFRGTLLLSGGVLFSIVVVMLFLRNRQLEYDPQLIADLQAFGQLSTYSTYIEQWARNTGAAGTLVAGVTLGAQFDAEVQRPNGSGDQ